MFLSTIIILNKKVKIKPAFISCRDQSRFLINFTITNYILRITQLHVIIRKSDFVLEYCKNRVFKVLDIIIIKTSIQRSAEILCTITEMQLILFLVERLENNTKIFKRDLETHNNPSINL